MENSCFDSHNDEEENNSLVRVMKPHHLMMFNVEQQLLYNIREYKTSIPMNIMSFDEKYVRHCLEMIHIAAAKGTTNSNMSLKLSSLPVGQLIIDTNIAKKSISAFRHYGDLENNLNFGENSLLDSSTSSLGALTICSSKNLEKDRENHGLDALHNRHNLISCSNQDSSSSCTNVSQGTVQCTWDDYGKPHFVFAVDDSREIYAANLLDNKAKDHMLYLFYSGIKGKKEHEMCTNESKNLVGKMKVSTSLKLNPNNSKDTETEFVLFDVQENHKEKIQNSTHRFFDKSLSKKVAKVFKSNLKETTQQDFCSWEPRHGDELAAIVIKEHIHVKHEEKIGGWGLNFLKKTGMNHNSNSRESQIVSECCSSNTDDCSTSIDVIIPAGVHGRPTIRNGGPSSLIERWRSGGCCDCGGWDIGCPLTVLYNRSCKDEALLQGGKHEKCKTIDLYIQGTDQGTPTLKKAKIHDGLYFIHFQSTLSALQCFSTAVAIIHSQRQS